MLLRSAASSSLASDSLPDSLRFALLFVVMLYVSAGGGVVEIKTCHVIQKERRYIQALIRPASVRKRLKGQ